VREAVAASVTYPPPRRCSSQLSVVVTTPFTVTFSRSQVIFGAAKYGSSGRPVMRANSPSRLRRRSQMAAERRSCQTIALLSGSPVALSQASTVSPWLASATAWAGARAADSARSPALTTERHSSSGSASTPPESTAVVATGTSARPRTWLPGPTSRAFVPEVPWSMARMFTRTPGLPSSRPAR
jgi:hypothetical protein